MVLLNHWLPLAEEDKRLPTFWVITGLGGVGYTVRVIALEVRETGDTHLAFEDSVQVITSPFTGVAIVIELSPAEPGIATPFLYQLIAGAVPGLVLVSVKIADSPEHNCVFGVLIDKVCTRLGETVIVKVLLVTTAGVAQIRLVVSRQLMISPLTNPGNTTVVKPEVPGISTPFFSHSIVGVLPGLPAVSVNVAVCPWQISVLGDEIPAVCVRLAFTVI